MDGGSPHDCIFCRVVAGELPSREAHSGELTYAFHDLRPVAPVHVLVVPRQHIADATEVSEEHGPLLAEMIRSARTVAEKRAFWTAGIGWRSTSGGTPAPRCLISTFTCSVGDGWAGPQGDSADEGAKKLLHFPLRP